MSLPLYTPGWWQASAQCLKTVDYWDCDDASGLLYRRSPWKLIFYNEVVVTRASTGAVQAPIKVIEKVRYIEGSFIWRFITSRFNCTWRLTLQFLCNSWKNGITVALLLCSLRCFCTVWWSWEFCTDIMRPPCLLHAEISYSQQSKSDTQNNAHNKGGTGNSIAMHPETCRVLMTRF